MWGTEAQRLKNGGSLTLFTVGRWGFADVAQDLRVTKRFLPAVYQSQSVKVHCRVSKVKVPKLKVNGCGFPDVNRGQTVEVQMSKGVFSSVVARSRMVEGR